MTSLSYTYRVSKMGNSYKSFCIEFPDIIKYAEDPAEALSMVKKEVYDTIQENKRRGFINPAPFISS